jgi:hypothetical protein
VQGREPGVRVGDRVARGQDVPAVLLCTQQVFDASQAGVDVGGSTAGRPEGSELLERVGAPNMPGNVKALGTADLIVDIGGGTSFKSEVNLLRLMRKRGSSSASTLRARPLE